MTTWTNSDKSGGLTWAQATDTWASYSQAWDGMGNTYWTNLTQ